MEHAERKDDELKPIDEIPLPDPRGSGSNCPGSPTCSSDNGGGRAEECCEDFCKVVCHHEPGIQIDPCLMARPSWNNYYRPRTEYSRCHAFAFRNRMDEYLRRNNSRCCESKVTKAIVDDRGHLLPSSKQLGSLQKRPLWGAPATQWEIDEAKGKRGYKTFLPPDTALPTFFKPLPPNLDLDDICEKEDAKKKVHAKILVCRSPFCPRKVSRGVHRDYRGKHPRASELREEIEDPLTMRLKQDLQKLFEQFLQRKIPIIWIYGRPIKSIAEIRRRFCIQFAESHGFTYLSLDEEIARFTAKGARALRAGNQNFEGFSIPQRLAIPICMKLVQNKGYSLSRQQSLEMLKYMLLHYFPTNGYIIDGFPWDDIDNEEFENYFYPIACGLYFLNSKWTTDKSEPPEVIPPLYFKRRDPYDEYQVEEAVGNFGLKTLKIINAEGLDEETSLAVEAVIDEYLDAYDEVLEGNEDVLRDSSLELQTFGETVGYGLDLEKYVKRKGKPEEDEKEEEAKAKAHQLELEPLKEAGWEGDKTKGEYTSAMFNTGDLKVTPSQKRLKGDGTTEREDEGEAGKTGKAVCQEGEGDGETCDETGKSDEDEDDDECCICTCPCSRPVPKRPSNPPDPNKEAGRNTDDVTPEQEETRDEIEKEKGENDGDKEDETSEKMPRSKEGAIEDGNKEIDTSENKPRTSKEGAIEDGNKEVETGENKPRISKEGTIEDGNKEIETDEKKPRTSKEGAIEDGSKEMETGEKKPRTSKDGKNEDVNLCCCNERRRRRRKRKGAKRGGDGDGTGKRKGRKRKGKRGSSGSDADHSKSGSDSDSSSTTSRGGRGSTSQADEDLQGAGPYVYVYDKQWGYRSVRRTGKNPNIRIAPLRTPNLTTDFAEKEDDLDKRAKEKMDFFALPHSQSHQIPNTYNGIPLGQGDKPGGKPKRAASDKYAFSKRDVPEKEKKPELARRLSTGYTNEPTSGLNDLYSSSMSKIMAKNQADIRKIKYEKLKHKVAQVEYEIYNDDYRLPKYRFYKKYKDYTPQDFVKEKQNWVPCAECFDSFKQADEFDKGEQLINLSSVKHDRHEATEEMEHRHGKGPLFNRIISCLCGEDNEAGYHIPGYKPEPKQLDNTDIERFDEFPNYKKRKDMLN